MSHYMFLSDIDGPRWALMGLVVKLAHSVSTRPHRVPFTFVDCLRFSAVFVRYLAWSSHMVESADCISQTEIAVGGVWTLKKHFDDGHFSGRYTPMTRGRYGTPQYQSYCRFSAHTNGTIESNIWTSSVILCAPHRHSNAARVE